jgi:hypothetical protein
MNQDNYLCEALKMRSLVSEFEPPRYDSGLGVPAAGAGSVDEQAQPCHLLQRWLNCWSDMRQSPVCLVGFREWVLSQDAGEPGDGAWERRVQVWLACEEQSA